MKKILAAILLLAGIGYATNNYVIRVPVVASYSDGGVKAKPTYDSVKFYGGIYYDTLIKAIGYTASPDSFEVDSSLGTVVYCTTTTPGVRITHTILYPSGNKDFLADYFEPKGPGNDAGALYRMLVGVIDTSVTPNVTTYPEGTKVTWRYYGSTREHYIGYTNSLGHVTVGVSLSPIVTPFTGYGSIYTVVPTRPGVSFASSSVIVDTVVATSSSVLGYNFIDTVFGYSTVPTSMSAVYLTMSDFESEYIANVKITASCQKKWNSCADRWFAMKEQEMGYTDANGYIEFSLPRSSCIENSKIDIYASYGGEFGRKLGSFTIPDSTSFAIKGE